MSSFLRRTVCVTLAGFVAGGTALWAEDGANGAAPPHQAQSLATPPVDPHSETDRPVLELRALDKITGHAKAMYAPVGIPVKFATLVITVRKCYSTPESETPETSAFLQIEDRRPHQTPKQVFSGWMYASSPGLNGMEHPLYDVWVIKCSATAPDHSDPDAADAGPQASASAGTVEDETAAPDVPGEDAGEPKAEADDTGH